VRILVVDDEVRLAMVRTITNRHRGSVTIGDAPLGGARFVVQMPAA